MKYPVLTVLTLILFCLSCKTKFPTQNKVHLGIASVQVTGTKITATTGEASRTWDLRALGLASVSFSTNKTNEILSNKSNCIDWDFPFMASETQVEVVGVQVRIDKDQGFLNEFIRTTVELHYPNSSVDLLYDIWTLPNAPGFRTQIHLKKEESSPELEEFALATVEQLQINSSLTGAKAIGYYNDTQHRNTASTPILKEKTFDGTNRTTINWANAIVRCNKTHGLILVKESHKCVNQQGVNTGHFLSQPTTITNGGAGLDKMHISAEYQPCWASWSILYEGSKEKASLALKQFDRKRYPIDPKRDIYLMSNTWGSGSTKAMSLYASREENILKEITTSKELGLDLLQVDDGWQGTQYQDWSTVVEATYNDKTNQGQLPDKAHYEVYPNGWSTIRTAAKNAGIKLGLWAAWNIPNKDLTTNYKLGDFRSFKLDFANLKNYQQLHDFENRVRSFILETDHKVRVNWDVTENPARIGYFYGREYGNIYLENRKPYTPVNVLYHPWLVLRDAWHVAHYTNLNKFQISFQNNDLVDREESDAYLHKHDYSLALTLMGSPIFFQEIHLLSPEARESIKPLIKNYKTIRNQLYKGYVFPVGDEPTNASWSGFQNYNPETNNGYLTLFRERNNEEDVHSIQLKFLANKVISFRDIMTGEIHKSKADFNGEVEFAIASAGDYRFYEMTY